ncbi:hypothetical protein GQ600_27831 [Phytophthora cactorum]|nr:hypothetical protein GQ600_27831 [Phytophthora cactorum]
MNGSEFVWTDNLEFESVEHKGYILATNQQFDDFLPRFSRYLLLELQDKSDSVRPELRMLLPVGSVEESSDEMVDIIIPARLIVWWKFIATTFIVA